MKTNSEKIDCIFRIEGVEVEVGYSFTCKCGKEITDTDTIYVDPCDVHEDNALELWDNEHIRETVAMCPSCGRIYSLDKDSLYEGDINVGKMMLISE